MTTYLCNQCCGAGTGAGADRCRIFSGPGAGAGAVLKNAAPGSAPAPGKNCEKDTKTHN